jgi:DNA repair protein RecN (Recombination protein N)
VLKSLSINNIVLIDKATIHFSQGLCILTGETGSGKSILLDAIGLVLGFRSNLRMIGKNDDRASVTAEFDISKNDQCKKILLDHDLIDNQNQTSIVIRRTIQENSTSKAFVNDILIGVNLLAKIGENLVEINGQHEQHGLLNSSFHLTILDEYANNQLLIKKLKKIFEELKEIDAEILDLLSKQENFLREKDYLQHVIKEIEGASIQENEEQELIKSKDQFIAREKILNFLNELRNNFIEANSSLIQSQKILSRNQNIINNFLISNTNEFDKINQNIDQDINNIDSATSICESIINQINNQENNREEIEERLFLIRNLARKFNVKVDELNNFKKDCEKKVVGINIQDELLEKLQKQKIVKLKEYEIIAKEITQSRKKAALILAKKVEQELAFLKMQGTKFLVEFKDLENNQSKQYFANGYESVKFMASINKNNFDEISKIASGGELSRFMLALKVALIDVKSVPTIIFDEIDSGISGSVADAVGKRLKILSKNLQVLVVTHHPQIASKADTHFKISKTNNNNIKTIIKNLDQENITKEIARMLSGEQISDEAIEVAKKLISE